MKTIKEQIENMTELQLIELNNRYCDVFGFGGDSFVYMNDEEFFNMFYKDKPWHVARQVLYGNYKLTDEYIKHNGYGNFETFNDMTIDCLPDRLERIVYEIEENIHEFSDLFNI